MTERTPPVMPDARWRRDGPRIYDRVRISPSAYWAAALRGRERAPTARWAGLVGTVICQAPSGPFVAVEPDRWPGRRPKRRRLVFWHADELELLSLRVTGEYHFSDRGLLRVVA